MARIIHPSIPREQRAAFKAYADIFAEIDSSSMDDDGKHAARDLLMSAAQLENHRRNAAKFEAQAAESTKKAGQFKAAAEALKPAVAQLVEVVDSNLVETFPTTLRVIIQDALQSPE